MKLRQITVKNFRCLADVTLSVSDNTILVGENNSGKTAVLDALRIALPWRAASGRTSPFDEYDYHMSKAGDSPTSPQEVPETGTMTDSGLSIFTGCFFVIVTVAKLQHFFGIISI